MRNLTITLGLVVFALAGFYAGAKYELNKATPAANLAAAGSSGIGATGTGGAGGAGGGRGTGGTAASPGTGGNGGFNGGQGGAGFARGTIGQISSISGNTLTITDAQGNQVKVQLSGTTTISKTVSGAQSDLANGVTVTVTGQRGSDGTVAATAIVIVPAGALPSPRG